MSRWRPPPEHSTAIITRAGFERLRSELDELWRVRRPEVVRALSRRHEITKLYSVSGRYDLCAMLSTESTHELDAVIDRIRAIKGVVDTFSTILLSTKLERPE